MSMRQNYLAQQYPRTEQLEPPTVEIWMLVLQGDDVMKIVE